MKKYRVSQEDRDTMREKLQAAQTLLNVHLVAELEGRRPPSRAVRLDMAEAAEELVHDVADMLDRLEAYVTVGGGRGQRHRTAPGPG